MLVAIKKYKFYRFIIKLKKLNIDLKKIEAIVNQQKLNNIYYGVWFTVPKYTS